MKNAIKLSLTTLVVALFATTAQAAHADQMQQGQMIDNSGLVITSYADGSVREFNLSQRQLADLKIFNHCNQIAASQEPVLPTVIALTSAR